MRIVSWQQNCDPIMILTCIINYPRLCDYIVYFYTTTFVFTSPSNFYITPPHSCFCHQYLFLTVLLYYMHQDDLVTHFDNYHVSVNYEAPFIIEHGRFCDSNDHHAKPNSRAKCRYVPLLFPNTRQANNWNFSKCFFETMS